MLRSRAVVLTLTGNLIRCPLNLRVAFVTTLLSISMATAKSRGQTHDLVCDGGFGSFEWRFRGRITVSVGAPKSQGFADHACQAKLTWMGMI